MPIYCMKCEGENDSDAAFCKYCGNPLSFAAAGAQPPTQPYASPAAPEVQTIERTSKKWKALQLGGMLVCVGGCGIGGCLYGQGGTPLLARVLVLAGFAGFSTFVYGRVSAWWHHG